jgi:hypothetical protein
MLLLVGNNYIDVVGAAETVVSDRKEAVGIWWQIDANDLRALVANNIKESRILMGESIVVLSTNID